VLGQIRQLRQLWRSFGPKWLAYRLRYAVRLRTGLLLRRLPATDWAAQPLHHLLREPSLAEPEGYLNYRRTRAPIFFFGCGDRPRYSQLLAAWDRERGTPVSIADGIGRGALPYFAHATPQVGFPPDWHRNPFTGQRAPATCHWSQIADFGYGDIKVIWEPSRFGFVYAMVRAYWRMGEESYAELFWQLVEDWRAQNPPQQGANWKCGQEISFRVMAWCFGLYGLLGSVSTTAERVAGLAQMIAVAGQRIEANLDYALSQRNNHGISEGMGLWTIGALFPELRAADKWAEVGRQVLERQARELIYDDGSFVQHSVNYHRLMLHDYLWALRLGDLHKQPFSADLKERVGKAGAFLYQIQDKGSGQVPHYGHDDGALILPLSNCDSQDFRPVIQAVHYLCTDARCYRSGPWDEDLLWLFGPDAVNAPVKQPQVADLRATIGGYYTLRSQESFVFVRCATFRDRPGQADMLHIDVWWRGQNVALDAGTYSYNAPAPWNNPLAHTAYHNTVAVDGLDQMERVGKFLWLPWLHSQVRRCGRAPVGCLTYWEGEHDGYLRLKSPVSHRRGILRLGDGWWLVLDALSSQGDHHYRLHWLFLDVPYKWDKGAGRLTLSTVVGRYYAQMATLAVDGAYSLVRADEDTPRGWRAPYYNCRQPALSVDLIAQGKSLSFWSLFGPEPGHVMLNGAALEIATEQWRGVVHLQTADNDQQPLVTAVSIAGALEGQFEISSCTFS
jgi:hypothetical protein